MILELGVSPDLRRTTVLNRISVAHHILLCYDMLHLDCFDLAMYNLFHRPGPFVLELRAGPYCNKDINNNRSHNIKTYA